MMLKTRPARLGGVIWGGRALEARSGARIVSILAVSNCSQSIDQASHARSREKSCKGRAHGRKYEQLCELHQQLPGSSDSDAEIEREYRQARLQTGFRSRALERSTADLASLYHVDDRRNAHATSSR